MKGFLWAVGGCAVAACWIALSPKKAKPLDVLAHDLQDAWADHHTSV